MAGRRCTLSGESPSELIDTAFDTCFAIEDAHLNPTSKQLAMDGEALLKLARHTSLPKYGALLLATTPSACYASASRTCGTTRATCSRHWLST